MGGEFVDFLPLKSNGALLGMVEAVDAVEEDGLTRAVGADDGMDLPRRTLKDSGKGGHLSEIHVYFINVQHYRPKLFRRHRAILLPEKGSVYLSLHLKTGKAA